jgi:hypothetical protein
MKRRDSRAGAARIPAVRTPAFDDFSALKSVIRCMLRKTARRIRECIGHSKQLVYLVAAFQLG